MDWISLESKSQPFRALIGALSLIVALLYLAGFSYRWSYYYNFGVQHLVFSLSFQSFLITAMELIRQPVNLVVTAISLVLSINIVNFLIGLLQRGDTWVRAPLLGRTLGWIGERLGVKHELVTDSIRAVVIMYIIFMLSAWIGSTRFREHVVNSPGNTLPAVNVVIGDEKFVLGCGEVSESLPNVIGDVKALKVIQGAERTCNSPSRVWRLLYRDDKWIYLFASEDADTIKNGRPLTMVIPNTDNTYIVME